MTVLTGHPILDDIKSNPHYQESMLRTSSQSHSFASGNGMHCQPHVSLSTESSNNSFLEMVQNLTDDQQHIHKEFDELQQQYRYLPEEHFEALAEVNWCKNRYADILPKDATRVKLMNNNNCSDYINASFISGEAPNTSKHYIACQAPLASTINDFWNMIWEQRCGVIVMLTKLQEKNQLKANCYWPEEGKIVRCGNFLLCNKKTFKLKDQITVRSLLIKEDLLSSLSSSYHHHANNTTQQQQQQHGEVREIVHIQMESWPDYGVPSSTKPIRDLVMLMRKMRERAHTLYHLNGPAVVHCSAGVGRTGTLIACDITLQKLACQQLPDIKHSVQLLRQQRPRMVINREQYQLVYSVIRDCARDEMVRSLLLLNQQSQQQQQQDEKNGAKNESDLSRSDASSL